MKMRKLLVCLGMVLSLMGIKAQTILEKETNLLRADDYLVKQQAEWIDFTTAGEDVIWDLSQLKIVDYGYRVSYMEYADSLLLARELRTLYKYSLQGDTLFSTGLENQTTFIQYYQQPELFLIYPVCYGDKQEGYYYGTGNYCRQLDLILKGKSAYHADAWGRIVLPEGDTICNVLRIHHTKLQVEEQYPHYSFSIIDSVCTDREIALALATDFLLTQTDTYRWYAPGYRYPVFETILTQVFYKGEKAATSATGFYYPPHEQYYGLEHDAENFAVRERLEMEKQQPGNRKSRGKEGEESTAVEDSYVMEGFTYRVEMGKEGESLRVTYQLYQQGEVEMLLTDMQGRTLERMPGSTHQAGSYEWMCSLLNYPKGEYLVRIIAQGEGYTEKIMK